MKNKNEYFCLLFSVLYSILAIASVSIFLISSHYVHESPIIRAVNNFMFFAHLILPTAGSLLVILILIIIGIKNKVSFKKTALAVIQLVIVSLVCIYIVYCKTGQWG